MYTLKTVTTYRVETVDDALSLRRWLERSKDGTLTSFKYTTKYIKDHGEVVGEYQVVQATMSIDNEKDPEGNMPVYITLEDEDEDE